MILKNLLYFLDRLNAVHVFFVYLLLKRLKSAACLRKSHCSHCKYQLVDLGSHGQNSSKPMRRN